MNSVSNFKSQWTEIRSNAVLFAGYLLGFLSKEKQSLLSKEHISNGKQFNSFTIYIRLVFILLINLIIFCLSIN